MKLRSKKPTRKKRITDMIPLSLLPSAQTLGWEAYAYSHYGKDGIPATAEIEKYI